MTDLDEIKRKIDIVDLVSQYLTLKKSGANYKAPCPFHNEKTPSFMVSSEKQIFKCFGCGEAGDVFGFVMKMEGLEFIEALKLLADRAGVQLESKITKEEFKKEKDIKSKLYKINQVASAIYHKILLEHKDAEPAREYLKKRGLNDATIKKYLLGYASEKPILLNYLLGKGCSREELVKAGNPERFRARIMFPILDVMGNTVGFTGRTLDSKIEPKYLNTPESPIFHKSRILYGLDIAKAEIKLQKKSIIVEGQMDVVLSHQAGVENVVATSGTALTPEHLKILGRYNNNIIFAFDADSAGSGAQKKAIKLAIENELNAHIIIMPKGIKDPGEAVEKNPKIWQDASRESIPAIEWMIEEAFQMINVGGTSLENSAVQLSGQKKKEIAKQILPIIKIIPDKIEQAHYTKILSKKLMVNERTLIEAINRIVTKKEDSVEKKSYSKKITLEENLIGNLLLYPEFIPIVAADLDYSDITNDDFSSQVYKALQSCYTNGDCENDFCVGYKCKNRFQKNLSLEYQEKIKVLILEIEANNESSEKSELKKEIIDSVKRIKDKKKDRLKEDFAKLISDAEESGKREDVKKLVDEFQRIISKK